MIRYVFFFNLQKAYAMQVCAKLFVPAVTAVIFLGCKQQISTSKTNRVLTCSAVWTKYAGLCCCQSFGFWLLSIYAIYTLVMHQFWCTVNALYNFFFKYIVPLEKTLPFTWCTKRLAPKNIPIIWKSLPTSWVNFSRFPRGKSTARDCRVRLRWCWKKLKLEESFRPRSPRSKARDESVRKGMDVLVVLRVNGLVITPKVGYIPLRLDTNPWGWIHNR